MHLVNKKGQLALRTNWDWKNVLAFPFKTIAYIGHSVEMAPRTAVFEKYVKKGFTDAEAAFHARRSTIDFQRSGTAVRQANAFFLYLNASVQGAAIPFRAARSSVAARWRMAGLLALATAAYAWNRQYPEYQDVPDYSKYNSIIVMLPSDEYDSRGNKVPHYFCIIPNQREWGMFTGPVTYILRELDGKAPEDFGQFIAAWAPNLNPVSQIVGAGAIPAPTQFVQALIELQMNWDSFRGRTIVPEDLINLPPGEQYNQYTSNTAIRIGQAIGYSPIRLQFIVENIFGNVGGQVLDIFDSVVRDMEEDSIDRIRLLLAQLQSIQLVSDPTKIPALRADFLQQLSNEDREAVLKLERSPEPRIPIISDIVRSFYRDWGGQIYQTAKKLAAGELDLTVGFKTAEEKLSSQLEMAFNYIGQFVGGRPKETQITTGVLDYITQRTRYLAEYSGSREVSWQDAVLSGAIASADLQKYMPEEYQWKPEEAVLNQYVQLQARLIEEAEGMLTDEKWSEINAELEKFLNSLPKEQREYISRHEDDWLYLLPEKVRNFELFLKEARGTLDGYYEIKGSENRTQYRKNNPQVDAYLYLLTSSTTLKSVEAEEILKNTLAQYGLPYEKVLTELDKLHIEAEESIIPYYDIEKGTPRLEFREANPEIDAYLFILGNVSVVRSEAAKRAVIDIIEKYKITDIKLEDIKVIAPEEAITGGTIPEEETPSISPLLNQLKDILG
jgi:hypothetical protein